MKLNTEKKYPVEIDGVSYELTGFNMKTMAEYQKLLGEKGEESVDLAIETLGLVGLPESVALKLDGEQVQQLLNYLMQKKS